METQSHENRQEHVENPLLFLGFCFLCSYIPFTHTRIQIYSCALPLCFFLKNSRIKMPMHTWQVVPRVNDERV